MAQQAGQLIAGRYRLSRCLARGGMGSVWVAEHIELLTNVAVKLLRPELGQDEQHLERFRREAQAAARLRSPHVVAIHDFGIDDGAPYIAMELLLGEDLQLRLERAGRLEPEEALRWLDEAARALSVAHAAGLIHRDIKPANLFIERSSAGDERLKVVDFGIAKPATEASDLTTGGPVWGSPAYMSPEQARGRHVDARTDVWALGSVFYRMLTGRLPFQGRTEHDTVLELCTKEAPAPSSLGLGLPEALDAVFQSAFTKDPQGRMSSVEELVQAAREALELPEAEDHRRGARPSRPGGSRPSHPGPSGGRTSETQPLPQAAAPAAPSSNLSPLPLPVAVPAGRADKRGPRSLWVAALLLGGAAAVGLSLVVRAPSAPSAPDPPPRPPPTTLPTPSAESSRLKPAETPAKAPRQASSAPPSASPPVTTRAPLAPPRRTEPKRARLPPIAPETDPLFGLPMTGDPPR